MAASGRAARGSGCEGTWPWTPGLCSRHRELQWGVTGELVTAAPLTLRSATVRMPGECQGRRDCLQGPESPKPKLYPYSMAHSRLAT